jgi:NADPH2:quinone reductase
VRMRAIWLRAHGGPEVLEPREAEDPVAGPGQVLVEVEWVNITFVETQFRATGFGPFKPELPMIPGNGVGGVVTAVGEDVDDGMVGRRVVTSTGGSGGYAELVAVDAGTPVEVPDGLALDDATALLADGRTALWLLDAVEVRAGERVLVEAAAGGVGSLLVQLAANAGAAVVGVAGGERKLALVRELGAEAVDYTRPDWAADAGPVDVVLDGVGGPVARTAFELLRPGGRMVSFGAASGTFADIGEGEAADRSVTLVRPERPGPAEQRELTRRALAEAAAGRLRPVIGQRFPLADAAAAHAAIEGRAALGKTLLQVR